MNISTHPHQVIIRNQQQRIKPLQVMQPSSSVRHILPVLPSIPNGDPYDVKKSSTTTLSVDNKFMGDCSEMILLFQAAQIERLNQSLEQYKNKFKQIQVRELDRQSYEIQIRELNSVISSSKQIRFQNAKLKEFIKRQNLDVGLEGFKIDLTDLSWISKYQTALKQIEQMSQERNRLVVQFNNNSKKLNSEKNALEQQLSVLKGSYNCKVKQAEQLMKNASVSSLKLEEMINKSKLSIQFQKTIQKYQTICGKLNIQIKRFANQLKVKTEEEIECKKKLQNLQSALRQTENSYQQLLRNQETNQQQNSKHQRELVALKSKNQQHEKSSAINSKNSEDILNLQNKIRLKDVEINNLISRGNALQQQLESIKMSTKATIQMLQQKITEISMINSQYFDIQGAMDRHIRQKQSLFEENNRLKQNFRLSTTNIQKINSQLIDVKRKILQLHQQNEILRQRIGGPIDPNQAHGRVQVLSLQIQRLNGILISKDTQISSLINQLSQFHNAHQIVLQENQHYKRRMHQNVQPNRRNQQSENRIIALSNEIERLNKLLDQNQKQSSGLIRRINQYEGLNQTITNLYQKINRLVNQNNVLTSDIKTAQENILASSNQFNNIRAQNEELKRIISQIQNGGNEHYQIHIHQLSEELQRINQLVEVKHSQNVNLLLENNKIKDLLNSSLTQKEYFKGRLGESSQSSSKIVEYQSKINELVHQAQTLKIALEERDRHCVQINSRYQQVINQYQVVKSKLSSISETQRRNLQYQNQIILLTNEIQRMNGLVSQRMINNQNNENLLSQYQLKINQTLQENEHLKIRLSQQEQLKKVVHSYQVHIRQLQNQNQILNRNIQEKSLGSTKVQNDILEMQTRLRSISNENQQLKKKLQNIVILEDQMLSYESNMVVITQQINRLNSVIQNKNRILQKQEYQKKQLIQRLQVANLQREEQINVSAQANSLQMKINEYEERILILTNEIKRLNTLLTEKINIQHKYQNEFAQTRVVISKLSLQNQQLRGRIDQNRELRIKLEQYEIKYLGTTNQITRLAHQLEKKTIENKHILSELQQYKSRVQKFADEVESSKVHMAQADRLRSALDHQQRRNYLLNQQMEKITSNINFKEAHSRQLQGQLLDRNSKLSIALKQNEQLKRKINDIPRLNSEVMEYQKRMDIVSRQIERLNNLVQQKNLYLTRASNQLNEQKILNTKFESQISSYQIKLNSSAQITSKVSLYQNRIQILTQEIQRLVAVNEQLRSQNHSFTIQLQQLSITQRHKLQAQYRLKTISEQSQFNRNRLSQYQKKVLQITQQFERLNIVIQQQKSYIEQLKQVNYEIQLKLQHYSTNDSHNLILGNQIDRLNSVLQRKNTQLSDIRINIADEAALINRMQEHLSLFVILFAEIQSLRKRVKDTEHQVEVVRRSNILSYKSS